jgi:hypothetical protein
MIWIYTMSYIASMKNAPFIVEIPFKNGIRKTVNKNMFTPEPMASVTM